MSAKATSRGRHLKSGARLETLSDMKSRLMKNPVFRIQYSALRVGEQIGDALAKARKAHGLTQAEVAKRAGTAQSVIARLENGRNGIPSLDLLNRVSLAVGLELSVSFKVRKAA